MRSRIFRHLGLALGASAGVFVAATTGGCTAITNTTAVQCTSEKECLALGPDFAGTTCDAKTKTCVKVPQDSDLCSRNQECVDRGGGSPAICRKSDRKCVSLVTPECPTLLAQPGQILDDNTLVIGALTPNGTVELGTVMEKAVELAQIDFSKTVRGLPPLPGKTESRPVVVLACREFGFGLEGLIRAANHLTKSVQVPVVIGPVDPANAAIAATNVFLPNRVLNILPTAIISGLTNLPNPIAPTPLIWRLNWDDKAMANLVNAYVQQVLEPGMANKGVSGPYRVAVVAEGNLLGQSSAARLQEVLKFNGKSATDNATDGNYISLNFGDLNDPIGNPSPETRIAQVLQAILTFKPHIVLHAYAVFGIQRILFPLENQWGVFNPGVPYPYHMGLTPPWNTFQPMYSFMDAPPMATPGPFGSRRQRIFAGQSRANPDTDYVKSWVIRFKSQFPEFTSSTTPDNQLAHALFDGTYQAVYAMAALNDKPITGENLAGTLGRFVPPGTLIKVGTDDIAKAFGILTSGQGFDIAGLLGHMDYDIKVAAPQYNLEITCPKVDMNTNKVVRMDYSGFYYDAATGMGAGTVTGCP